MPDSFNLTLCLHEFDEAWQTEKRPQMEQHLAQAAVKSGFARCAREVCLELVMIDQEYRWRRQLSEETDTSESLWETPFPARPLLEDYVTRFAQLGRLELLPYELIAEEFRVRHRWGDKPAIAEYVARFGDRAAELGRLAKELSMTTPVVKLKLYDRQRVLHSLEFSGILELGRQKSGEDPPYAHSSTDTGRRLVITGRSNTKISRKHVLLAVDPDARLRVASLTAKGEILIYPKQRLAPGAAADISLPALLLLGGLGIRLSEIMRK